MTGEALNISDRWRAWRRRVDLTEYSQRFDRLAAAGADVHGEADFVEALGGELVLDAGCGTGRVAIELARRGRTTIGVDNDPDMLAVAEANGPTMRWVLADLATVDLGVQVDSVVMAGDVLNFVRAGDEPLVIANLGRHLAPGGLLVVGASVARPDRVAEYDGWCATADLEPVVRYRSWEREPFVPSAGYAVSVHRRIDVEEP